jgi:hypothetical protein
MFIIFREGVDSATPYIAMYRDTALIFIICREGADTATAFIARDTGIQHSSSSSAEREHPFW